MRRCAYTLVVILSLLACAGNVVMWVRSYSDNDSFGRSKITASDAHSTTKRTSAVQWAQGQTRFSISSQTVYSPTKGSPDTSAHWGYFRYGPVFEYWSPAPLGSVWNQLGFAVRKSDWTSSMMDSHSQT